VSYSFQNHTAQLTKPVFKEQKQILGGKYEKRQNLVLQPQFHRGGRKYTIANKKIWPPAASAGKSDGGRRHHRRHQL
jgi:hypothetical protein